MKMFRRKHWLPALTIATMFSNAQAMELLSLDGIKLAKNEYISGFDIQTWGIDIYAVCNIPAGWTISAGGLSGDSSLSGQSLVGAANLDQKRIIHLKNLFLIKDQFSKQSRAADEQPAFIGKIIVGTYGENASLDDHEKSLAASNYVMKPAQACPKPDKP